MHIQAVKEAWPLTLKSHPCRVRSRVRLGSTYHDRPSFVGRNWPRSVRGKVDDLILIISLEEFAFPFEALISDLIA